MSDEVGRRRKQVKRGGEERREVSKGVKRSKRREVEGRRGKERRGGYKCGDEWEERGGGIKEKMRRKIG